MFTEDSRSPFKIISGYPKISAVLLQGAFIAFDIRIHTGYLFYHLQKFFIEDKSRSFCKEGSCWKFQCNACFDNHRVTFRYPAGQVVAPFVNSGIVLGIESGLGLLLLFLEPLLLWLLLSLDNGLNSSKKSYL